MADQSKVAAVANRLHALGGRRGAFLLLLNAAAQSQAAQAGDLPQRPAFGRQPAEQPHAPNDNHPDTPEQPGGTVA